MDILVGGFFILFGLGWLIVMGGMYIFGVNTPPDVSLPWYMLVLWIGPGVVTLPIGTFLVIFGLVRSRKKKDAVEDLVKYGVGAKARVTFVDKNFRLLVNQAPIYSIVEFEFRDDKGNLFTGRKDNVNSELVIRNKIEVGSEVDIKYMPGDPSINGLLLVDPRVAARQN